MKTQVTNQTASSANTALDGVPVRKSEPTQIKTALLPTEIRSAIIDSTIEQILSSPRHNAIRRALKSKDLVQISRILKELLQYSVPYRPHESLELKK